VYSALAYPGLAGDSLCAGQRLKPAAEIALEVGLARQTVHNLVAAYNRHGPSALETAGEGNGNVPTSAWNRSGLW
jgi:predicted transcriptional regulator